jgi:hypothetical protein
VHNRTECPRGRPRRNTLGGGLEPLSSKPFVDQYAAMDSIVEAIPSSAFIEPSQSSELIFCAQSDRL